MTAMTETIAAACALVPGLVHGALVLLPDGILLGGVGATSVLDHEPLLRSATRCLAVRPMPAIGAETPSAFVEYVFVLHDQLVVIQGGRRDPRLALAVACSREPNLMWVVSSTRRAIETLETTIDLAAWGV